LFILCFYATIGKTGTPAAPYGVRAVQERAKVMLTDFYQAYKRHWEDANYLLSDCRWPNADQLYGYAAECGLKCLMLRFGMALTPAGTPPHNDMVHIDKLWVRYETYRAGAGAAGYLLSRQNPFDNWHSSQRYADGSIFSQSSVEIHRQGAESVRCLVNKAISEGILTL
jgi:hypothetical protein